MEGSDELQRPRRLIAALGALVLDGSRPRIAGIGDLQLTFTALSAVAAPVAAGAGLLTTRVVFRDQRARSRPFITVSPPRPDPLNDLIEVTLKNLGLGPATLIAVSLYVGDRIVPSAGYEYASAIVLLATLGSFLVKGLKDEVRDRRRGSG